MLQPAAPTTLERLLAVVYAVALEQSPGVAEANFVEWCGLSPRSAIACYHAVATCAIFIDSAWPHGECPA